MYKPFCISRLMIMKQKILVAGSNGQLGKEIREKAVLYPQFEFLFLVKEDFPIQDKEAVQNIFHSYRPQYFINCAAYTAVDKAEEEKELAFRINADAVGLLAAACKEYYTKFIHISTDYVFDGDAKTPYEENAPVSPQSVYGASKLEGEKLALQNNPDSIIIRTSWVYSSYGKNFVKTMLRLLQEKKEISVVNDQLGSPTYAANLAELILFIIASQNWQQGIFHFSNEGVISWYEFAAFIKELSGSDCIIHPVTTAQYPTAAKRPAWSVLDNRKIQQVYGIRLKNWQDSLAECLSKLINPPR
ncbi:MAG: dTDP-4-dehydrorhamnose reductase [Chitinophagaceae bacterium]